MEKPEFKKASDIEIQKSKEVIFEAPETRAERIASILATLEKYPEGLNIQYFIATIAQRWGITRRTIIDYLLTLERARKTRVGADMKIYIRKEKK